MSEITQLAYDSVIDTSDVRTLQRVSSRTTQAGKHAPLMTPVSPCTNWVDVNTDASINVPVTIPGDIDFATHPQLKVLDCGYAGTSVLIRMRYPQSVPTATSIRVYGFDGSYFINDGEPIDPVIANNVAPKPEQLFDSNGNLTIVLTPDVPNDPQDADGNAYTVPVRLDFHGNLHLIFPAVTGTGQGVIEARVI